MFIIVKTIAISTVEPVSRYQKFTQFPPMVSSWYVIKWITEAGNTKNLFFALDDSGWIL